MKGKPYPNIPDTEFREIPKSVLNLGSEFEWPLDKMPEDLFHGYAITNKGDIWYGRGLPWHKVELNKDHKGEKTVVLRFFGQEGQTIVPFKLLFKKVFGEWPST